jgi:hypothetical protein
MNNNQNSLPITIEVAIWIPANSKVNSIQPDVIRYFNDFWQFGGFFLKYKKKCILISSANKTDQP